MKDIKYPVIQPTEAKLEGFSNKKIYNYAIKVRLHEWYGHEYADMFNEVLGSGMEPSWMSDYFDTWQYLKEDFDKLRGLEFYKEAYESAHDVAMFIYDGLKSEGY